MGKKNQEFVKKSSQVISASTALDVYNAFTKISDRNPLIFLDYDGTLVNIVLNPWEAFADQDLLTLLSDLSKRYETFVVTGRSIDDIESLLPLNLNLIALHGSVTRRAGKAPSYVSGYNRYKAICQELFSNSDELKRSFPGLRIFDKGGGLLFHMGLMDKNLEAGLQRRVEEIGRMAKMTVYAGYNILELRIPGVSKGTAIRKVRAGNREAMIAGDEGTDEEAFEMNVDALKVKVRVGETIADFMLRDVNEMRSALKLITYS